MSEGKVAMFAGPADNAFRSLQASVANGSAEVQALVARANDVVKNVAKVDVLKMVEAAAFEGAAHGEEGAWIQGFKTMANVAAFAEKHNVADVDSLYLALTGDRPGMLAAVAVAASKDATALGANMEEAIKAGCIAGEAGRVPAEELVKRWSAAGVKLPAASALRVPVFAADGRGDLRKASDLTEQLAALLVVGDAESTPAMQESHDELMKAVRTVVPFGCPKAAGGQLQLNIDGIRDEAALNYALPDVAAIKREVVRRGHTVDVSLVLSFFWLFHDFLVNGAVAYALHLLSPYYEEAPLLKWLVVWPIYSLIMGTTLTGLWVIGHECGHRAFAGTGANSWINDVVGFMTHTPLLVPFWAWRYSHHKHHMFTNHLLDGETHVPNHRNGAKMDHSVWQSVGEDAFVIWNIIQHLVFGWPLYLMNNATGGRRTPQGKKIDRKKSVSHFVPESQVFEDNQRSMIMPGTIGCIAWLAVLAYVDFVQGLGTTLFWFWGAYLVTNGWLVLYTWLHHSDKEIPHFGDGQFSYMRGATCSIDRKYPALINYIHHHIGSTHVMHHISFQVPHYRAEAATEVYRSRWPHLYRHDSRPLLQTMMEVSATCHYVDDVTGVQYYKSLDQLKKKN